MKYKDEFITRYLAGIHRDIKSNIASIEDAPPEMVILDLVQTVNFDMERYDECSDKDDICELIHKLIVSACTLDMYVCTYTGKKQTTTRKKK